MFGKILVDQNLFWENNAISSKFSEYKGRFLENLVFIELKRRGKEIRKLSFGSGKVSKIKIKIIPIWKWFLVEN